MEGAAAMIPPDAYVKGFTALFTGVLAALLLVEGRGRTPARILGVFLALIGLNSAAEAARALAADGATQLAAFRVASIAASLDPVALCWFAASLARPDEAGRSRWMAPALAAGGALALYAGWGLGRIVDPSDPGSEVFSMLLTAFTLAVYGSVLVWAVQRLRRGPREGGWRFLVPALAMAAIPPAGARTVAAIWGILRPYGGADVSAFALSSVSLLLSVLAAAALVLWTRRDPPQARKVIALSVVLPLGIVLMTFAAGVVDATPFGQAETAMRWIVFGAFASMAILRGQALGWSLHARRRAARVLLGAVFLLLAGLALLVVQPGSLPASFLLANAMVLLAALALSQGFGKVVDEAALRLYGVPKPGDIETAKAVYQRAAAEALAQGREPARDAELQALREELSLDAKTAGLLERLAEDDLPGPLAPGRLVAGRYAVRRLLGRGSAGRAFLARDQTLERDVVLKEVLADGEGESKAALREARAAGGLQHPNIVTVYDVISRGGASYLVTEYVEGGSLAERIAASHRTDPARLLGLAEGLAAAHAKGIVHRDVKPQNVLAARSGALKLADFGIARASGGTTADAADALAGTPEYMAPERRAGDPAGPASDVYALGLVIRRAALGALPPAWEGVVQRATRERPGDRWRDAGEMAAALRAALPPEQQ